jgi:hypothetical protein
MLRQGWMDKAEMPLTLAVFAGGSRLHFIHDVDKIMPILTVME